MGTGADGGGSGYGGFGGGGGDGYADGGGGGYLEERPVPMEIVHTGVVQKFWFKPK